jgi:hypothetical protein
VAPTVVLQAVTQDGTLVLAQSGLPLLLQLSQDPLVARQLGQLRASEWLVQQVLGREGVAPSVLAPGQELLCCLREVLETERVVI